MADLLVGVPDIDPSDPEPVVTALETARALYLRGDLAEALRFMRRAAERAEEGGDDLRAVALARAAADLAPIVSGPPPMSPSAPVVRAPTPAPVPASPPDDLTTTPPSSAGRDDEAVALAPYDDFNDQTIVDSPSATVALQAQMSGVQITDVPPPPMDFPGTPATVPSPPTDPRPGQRVALRVAVSLVPDGSGTLVARLLPDGCDVPDGCSEALLVPLKSGTDFFSLP